MRLSRCASSASTSPPARCLARRASTIGVCNCPGTTVFTRMPLARILHGDHARELDHAGLGRGIADLERAGEADAGGRGQIDDGAAFCFSITGSTCLQVRNTLLRLESTCASQTSSLISTGPPCAEPPTLLTSTSMRPKRVDAGLHHGGDRGAVGDVALLHDDLAADGLHPLDGLGGAVEIAVDRENLGAFLGEAHAGGAAVAPAGPDAAGAGDDGDACPANVRSWFWPPWPGRSCRSGRSAADCRPAAPAARAGLGAICVSRSTSTPSSGMGPS